MKKNVTCILCPRGCSITVEGEKDSLRVSGNTCPRGEKYAIAECTCPMRTVTTVIRVSNRENTVVSVKTASPIPKEKMFAAMEQIRTKCVEAPVEIGDCLLKNVFGADIVATAAVK